MQAPQGFVLAEDGDVDKIIVYASSESLDCLLKLTTSTLMEHSEPVPGCSITIQAFFHGQQFPLIYCLLPSKSCMHERCTTAEGLTTFKTVLQQWGYVLEPTSVVADFEPSPYPICGASVPHIHNQGVFLPLHTGNLEEGSESWHARGIPR